jgi:hypothetical protein
MLNYWWEVFWEGAGASIEGIGQTLQVLLYSGLIFILGGILIWRRHGWQGLTSLGDCTEADVQNLLSQATVRRVRCFAVLDAMFSKGHEPVFATFPFEQSSHLWVSFILLFLLAAHENFVDHSLQ